MKAGTIWLYHMLRRHPELLFPLEKGPITSTMSTWTIAIWASRAV